MKKNLVKIILLLLVIAGVIYYFPKIFQKKSLETKRMDTPNRQIPADYPKGVPLPYQAKITESYSLVDPNTSNSTEVFVVAETPKTAGEVRDFYKTRLTEPRFKFIENSDAGDTDDLKILTYSAEAGIVEIRIQKTGEAGSKLTIHETKF